MLPDSPHEQERPVCPAQTSAEIAGRHPIDPAATAPFRNFRADIHGAPLRRDGDTILWGDSITPGVETLPCPSRTTCWRQWEASHSSTEPGPARNLGFVQGTLTKDGTDAVHQSSVLGRIPATKANTREMGVIRSSPFPYRSPARILRWGSRCCSCCTCPYPAEG